jgi:hypothetical protein
MWETNGFPVQKLQSNENPNNFFFSKKNKMGDLLKMVEFWSQFSKRIFFLIKSKKYLYSLRQFREKKTLKKCYLANKFKMAAEFKMEMKNDNFSKKNLFCCVFRLKIQLLCHYFFLKIQNGEF